MRINIYFVVLGLCLLTGSCDSNGGTLDIIDIGDYEYHLEAWNSLNMFDYQISAEYSYPGIKEQDYISIRNGIPESGSPVIPGLGMSTIPELYSWLKKVKSGNTNTHFDSFKVVYNTEYHYPNEIVIARKSFFNSSTSRWQITVMPLEEGELDIDIGDYEYHLDAWNSQNMLDYQLKVSNFHGRYNYITAGVAAYYNVKGGLPDRATYDFHKELKEATVPEIYELIKEEEEKIRNVYNGINRSYLHVQYNTEYHYPTKINTGIDHSFGAYERWEFTLTPEETE